MLFGIDINSSMHTDIKEKCILVLSKGSTQGLDDTTVTEEAE